MKLALQYEMQRPSLDDHKLVQETLEQCVLADEVGFDYLWFVEHHFLSGGAALAHKIWEDLDADTLCDRAVIIAGDPDSCIEALKKHEAIGVDQMMVMMQTETVPHEKVMKSIELFGEHVIPEFKTSEKAKSEAAD